jgi:hypothetical protein
MHGCSSQQGLLLGMVTTHVPSEAQGKCQPAARIRTEAVSKRQASEMCPRKEVVSQKRGNRIPAHMRQNLTVLRLLKRG